MDKALEKKVIAALKEVYDPELPVSIYDLGLIYNLKWEANTGTLHILMTLTTPSCPAAEIIPANIKESVLLIPEIKAVEVNITFDPPYDISRLSEEGKLLLGRT